MRSDLRFALRALLRRPGYLVTGVLLLALGAAGNAVVFSMAQAVLVRPLSFERPERLVAASGSLLSQEDVLQLGARSHELDALAAQSTGWLMALVAPGLDAVKVTGSKVTGNFFSTLGTGAHLGRTIRPGEDAPGRHRVAVLSYELWRTRFGGAPGVIRRTIELDGEPYAIVGVMPRRFEAFGPGTDLWVPLPQDPAARWHRAQFMESFARLAPHATPASAQAEMQAMLSARRAELSRPADWARLLHLRPLHDVVADGTRDTLVLLGGAVVLVLFLLTVNLGALTLGQGLARSHEMAIRTALGAPRSRLLRQLLLEQALLAAAGAGSGAALAYGMLPAVVARLPADVPRRTEIAADPATFGLVVAGVVGTSLLLATIPLLLATRADLRVHAGTARSGETPGRRRTFDLLVTAQVALAVVLGTAAGLTLRSLWHLQHVDPGFSTDGVLTFRLQTTATYDSLETGLPYFEQVVERLRALPGVDSVGAAAHLPMTGYSWNTGVTRPESPPPPGAEPPRVGWRFVGWDYFAAMRIAIRHGRAFDAADSGSAPPVGILNETLARRLFGSPAAAVGRDIVHHQGATASRVRIVGIAADVRHSGLALDPAPELYRPFAQTFMFPMAFVVRGSLPAAQLGPAVRQATAPLDRTVPVAELQPLAALIAESIARPRLLAWTLGLFAGAGLLLEAVGIYGLAAFRVRQREREIGLRIALGAAPAHAAGLVLRQGARLTVLGLAIGLPLALALSRVAGSVVHGISVTDPLTFAALPLVVAAATLVACARPAIAAAATDPARVLRSE